MKIIDGRSLAEKIKDDIVKEITAEDLQNAPGKTKVGFLSRRPNLAIVLVGEREDSVLYVGLKEKEARKVGIDTHVYRCDADIAEHDLIRMIEFLNSDDGIDAILVQLPLPDNQNTDKVISAITPDKDVDRFHPENYSRLMSTCDHAHFMPPVYGAVLHILEQIDCELHGATACVIANSELFGRGLAKTLECQGAAVTTLSPEDAQLADKTVKADILISACGRAGFIKADMVKKDAVLIDIGISMIEGKTIGDIDPESVKDKAGFLTPVPGGIGPLTIAMLFKNTLHLYQARKTVKT